MSESDKRQVPQVGAAGMYRRLDTWKEIASYLRHDVRTVQRWERDGGLPVHRRPTKRRGMVFAYEQELDEWWRAAQDRLTQQPGMRVLTCWLVRAGWVVSGAAATIIAYEVWP